MSKVPSIRPSINYSCHFAQFRDGEQFVHESGLGMVIAGVMELNDGKETIRFGPGDVYYTNRNHLMKFVKYPPAGGEFKSLSIRFDEPLLRAFRHEHDLVVEVKMETAAFVGLGANKALTGFMQSLLSYEDLLTNRAPAELVRVKQQEALFLLLAYDPSLKNSLFDFSEPHKIDLEAFMEKNFQFNVQLDRFAFLTGRSLSTFKRDFEKIFHQTPSRWLLQRRLQEAHYLITKKGKTASEVYLDLGFENLSHFSYAFKNQFGEAPSASRHAY